MRIEHVAIWAEDIEKLKSFYTTYFNMESGEKYINTVKQFHSYFLNFQDQCATRIEIMHKPGILGNENIRGEHFGFAHIAINVGDRKKVNDLTEQLRNDGYTIIGAPRTTGDGYYESIIEDPEGNWIEIIGF